MTWMIRELTMMGALLAFAACSTYGVNSGDDGGTDAVTDGPADAGMDAGQDAGADAGQDAGGLCMAEAPQHVVLQIGEDPWSQGGCAYQDLEASEVLYVAPEQAAFGSEFWLWFDESDCLAKVTLRLPEGWAPPLRIGEQLWATATNRSEWSWDMDLRIQENGPLGPLRLSASTSSFFDPDFIPDCTPAEDDMGCSTVAYPSIQVQPSPAVPAVELEQGGSAILASDDGLRAYQVFVGELYQYVNIWCTDLPSGWLNLAEIDLSRHSMPSCADDTQCAPGHFCDARLARCLPDRCADVDCGPDEICDPYRGTCLQSPGVVCNRDEDCLQGERCNPRTGACVSDVCQVMDCMGACDSLIGGCYLCLHDSDCWPGLCNEEDRLCIPACNMEKLNFGRPNPQRFDRFIACVDEALEDDATALMQKYLGDVNCAAATADDPCDGLQELICQGPLELLDGEGSVEGEQWFSLCALSRLDVIHGISGSQTMP